jgi:hypothetical protein
MPALSLIIVGWNSRGPLRGCLDSIRAARPQVALEIIVVDNGSRDGTSEFLRREHPAVRRIVNPGNRGFAAACNQGAAAAGGACLVFLNPDSRVHAGTLERAAAFMDRHAATGIMGCRTMNPDGSLQRTARTFPTPARICAHVAGLGRGGRIGGRRSARFDYVQGSFLVVRREVFRALGGFDERFFLYGEEVDLCLRARRAGVGIAYDADTVVTHQGGGSGGRERDRTPHFIASCLRLYRRHRRRAQAVRLARLVRLALHLRLAKATLSAPRARRLALAEHRRLKRALAEAPGDAER